MIPKVIDVTGQQNLSSLMVVPDDGERVIMRDARKEQPCH